jgi:hypothetical protein
VNGHQADVEAPGEALGGDEGLFQDQLGDLILTLGLAAPIRAAPGVMLITVRANRASTI